MLDDRYALLVEFDYHRPTPVEALLTPATGYARNPFCPPERKPVTAKPTNQRLA